MSKTMRFKEELKRIEKVLGVEFYSPDGLSYIADHPILKWRLYLYPAHFELKMENIPRVNFEQIGFDLNNIEMNSIKTIAYGYYENSVSFINDEASLMFDNEGYIVLEIFGEGKMIGEEEVAFKIGLRKLQGK
jgi:hypothetical protein